MSDPLNAHIWAPGSGKGNVRAHVTASYFCIGEKRGGTEHTVGSNPRRLEGLEITGLVLTCPFHSKT